MRALQGNHFVAGHRGGVSAHWRRAGVAAAALALPLAASGISAAPASAAGGYTVTRTIPVGSGPSGVAVDTAARTAYVTNFSSPVSAAAPSGDPAFILQALGLTVMTNDGYIAAQGAAAAVQTATALFAGAGDLAVYSGDNETGTGTIALAVDPPAGADYAELQVNDAPIASVQDDYTDPFGIYNDSGDRIAVVPAETEENTGSPGDTRQDSAVTPDASGAGDAAVGSPGVVSGNNIQVPIRVPVNVCGNSIDVIGLLDPDSGNTC